MSKEFVHAILLNFQTQYNDCSEIFNALKISGYVQGVEIYKSSWYSLSSHEKSSDWINVLQSLEIQLKTGNLANFHCKSYFASHPILN